MRPLVVLIALAVASASALSIEREPVKVTHRNSGPRYDLDDVERTHVADNSERPAPPASVAEREGAQQGDGSWPAPSPMANQASQEEQEQGGPVHILVRRIFLVPIGPRARPDWQGGMDSGSPPAEEQPQPGLERPSLASLWPLLRPPHRFGADEASRAPGELERPAESAESGTRRQPSGGEREEEQAPARPMFDPIQMMMDMMHQAIGSQLGAPAMHDLNKPAEGQDSAASEQQAGGGPTEMGRPMRQGSHNETKQEVVEIEGKKYLRKTVINRHVGDNIVLMTRRLIFEPLNETDSAQPTSTSTTAAPTTPVGTSEQPSTGSPAAPSMTTGAEAPASPPTAGPVGVQEKPNRMDAAELESQAAGQDEATTTSETTRTEPVASSSEPSATQQASGVPAASATTTTTTTVAPDGSTVVRLVMAATAAGSA